MSSIVLTGGGSAGHVTPHLAIIPYLRNDFEKIYYIGSENGIERSIIEAEHIPYYFVNCAKVRRKLTPKNLLVPFKVLDGISKSKKILKEIKPNVVFSKGGYVSVPIVLAAKQLNIPVIAHESDYTFGLANKFTARYCQKVLTSFPEAAKSVKNGEYVGPPIRKGLFKYTKPEGLKYFGFNGIKPVLLITGGSQGASFINDIIFQSLSDLLPKYDILHIVGKGNINQKLCSKEYEKNGYKQVEYVSDMGAAFSACSVCVSRAGSNSVFEILSLKIPCVLIPLPKGISRGDQELNALYFERLGLSYTLLQNALTSDSIVSAINATYANRFNRANLFDKHHIQDSSRLISSILGEYVKH